MHYYHRYSLHDPAWGHKSHKHRSCVSRRRGRRWRGRCPQSSIMWGIVKGEHARPLDKVQIICMNLNSNALLPFAGRSVRSLQGHQEHILNCSRVPVPEKNRITSTFAAKTEERVWWTLSVQQTLSCRRLPSICMDRYTHIHISDRIQTYSETDFKEDGLNKSHMTSGSIQILRENILQWLIATVIK